MKESKHTVEEVATLKGVHKITVYRWIKDGLKTKIVPMVGRRTRHMITMSDVEKFLKGGSK